MGATGAALIAATLPLTQRASAAAGAKQNSPGVVYAMTNDASDNRIVIYQRAADGTLTLSGSVSTGGRGSGSFENSSNGLILAGLQTESSPANLGGSARFLIATNAGSNDISVFAVRSGDLELVDVEPSQGTHPVSVTLRNKVLYALNGGISNGNGIANIAGFRVASDGDLTPIPGAVQPVVGNPVSGAAQVGFNVKGDVLVVTERQGDIIDSYIVDKDGIASPPIANQTTGNGPFGFAFTRRDQLITTENFGAAPLQGGVASYDVLDNGTLVPLGPTTRNFRSDTCWAVITDNQKYLYTTNFQSGDISSYRVDQDGTTALINSTAGVVGVGASDEALSVNSQFLYARNALQGTISVFRVEADGSLTALQVIGGIPPGGAAIGLAAR